MWRSLSSSPGCARRLCVRPRADGDTPHPHPGVRERLGAGTWISSFQCWSPHSFALGRARARMPISLPMERSSWWGDAGAEHRGRHCPVRWTGIRSRSRCGVAISSEDRCEKVFAVCVALWVIALPLVILGAASGLRSQVLAYGAWFTLLLVVLGCGCSSTPGHSLRRMTLPRRRDRRVCCGAAPEGLHRIGVLPGGWWTGRCSARPGVGEVDAPVVAPLSSTRQAGVERLVEHAGARLVWTGRKPP